MKQVPGFKIVINKETNSPEYYPNRAKLRQLRAINRHKPRQVRKRKPILTFKPCEPNKTKESKHE